MPSSRPTFDTVDQYIATFPKETQTVLEKMRSTIKKELPGAEEMISYQIPAFKLNGRMVVYFAGYARHVSVYPIPDGPPAFEAAIKPHIHGKGTLRFELSKPIPYDLIGQVAKYHREQVEKK